MRSIKLPLSRRVFFYLLVLVVFILFRSHLSVSNVTIIKLIPLENHGSACFEFYSIEQNQTPKNRCLPNSNIISTIWTHDGTGVMKYIQWIATRKLENVRITRLNEECALIQENDFFSNPKNDRFIQVYVISLLSKFDNKSKCSTDLTQAINLGMPSSIQIYFKRRSTQATLVYQLLDQMRQKHHFHSNWLSSANKMIVQARSVSKNFIKFLGSTKHTRSIIIECEDMIHLSLNDTEKMLRNFSTLVGLNTLKQNVKDAIEYDCYHFMKESTWWDQSETVKHLVLKLLYANRPISENSTDSFDLHGNRSLIEYIADNRQCFNDGTFFQMQSETMPNRSSTDQPERCSGKKFDCAFGDIYSFSDREQLYKSYPTNGYFNPRPIKCGFAVESVIDKVRRRYARNEKCKVIVLTCITNCYDPLPNTQDDLPPDTCFVALLDTKTYQAVRGINAPGIGPGSTRSLWDLIDLGDGASLFRVPAKATESMKMLGHRMFPLAKWFVWLDGKAYLMNTKAVLSGARTPIMGLRHHDFNRTSDAEVNLTIARIKLRELENSVQLTGSLQEIALQEAQYKRDGFYSRSNAMGLRMYDIAIFIYRNNHPCAYRYLCGWHNEVNYFSYRGQLSVFYAAERLNLSAYFGIVPRHFYHTWGHRNVC